MKLWLCSASCKDYALCGLHIADTEEEAETKFSKSLDDEGIWYASVYVEEVTEVDGYRIALIEGIGKIPKKPRIE